ncbi:DUF3307 domain-containing protein [Kiritimatiellota bacterium B12222]|nr:DUF3307 domain-containing protein [Kiritimatiellota bacterium B12222]
MNNWIIPLLCAHVLGDFLLQPDWMATEKKRKMRILMLHAGIHGVLAYVCVQQWGAWGLCIGVMLGHGLIDFFKCKCGTGLKAFLCDQLAHVVFLLAVSLLLPPYYMVTPLYGVQLMVMVTGFGLTVWGAGHFIRCVADQLCEENENLKKALGEGLQNGGAMIGKLERALIFLMIFMGQPGGVGFLVGAKSIIRFQEAKQQPLAEYVLIGTLWSFGLAMAIASVTKYIFEWSSLV